MSVPEFTQINLIPIFSGLPKERSNLFLNFGASSHMTQCYNPNKPIFNLCVFLSGFPKEGSASRDLLPLVALPRPSEPPRVEASGTLRVRISLQKGGGLYQPIPLHQGGSASAHSCASQ